ncbi:hypothetical protein DW726_04965 [Streptococcus gordonii]|uniref:SAG1252 family conjugative relaxosome accessory protein n=1 Tax=Streptococcus gordonii TaxID=1302 RepID=UPI000E46E836|nr:SAG1252 family conjugative relaxosome accessory protein [Streptococcus gordonii]RHE64443.1 hypothetical protein DW726_04965 [Streptococcus gordonii]
MSEQYRDVRKEVNLTANELEMIEVMMKNKGFEHFSPFARNKLLEEEFEMTAETWFTLWKSQKLEQISRDVHEVLILAQSEHQVTQEHVSILLTCVQELIKEVGNSSPLSQEFREKYMR